MHIDCVLFSNCISYIYMSSSLKNDYGYFSSKILDEILLEKHFKNKNPNARLGLTSEDY